ncbi:pectinesterase family protein [Azohydromonas caseinilytica]|uniref:Pectinesterase n=1 Tax=Azohydromonas caseinilytica TaxID=2728836 RepID=A0A848FD19_9BURK|nr:pectinesterase family protein [Azohydromonas caseinilytica]NML16050.1 acyl-CoA thioesterase [Azohydromonas caseinilytica]
MHFLPRPALAAAVAAACALAACGGGSENSETVRETAAAAGVVDSTATRPQLSLAEAAHYTVGRYLAQAGSLGLDGSSLTVDGWTPPQVGEVERFTPTFVVAADGSGTHTTLQAALDAVPAATQSGSRHYILVKPGSYREVVCASGKAPITLYGAGDAAEVVVVAGHYNGEAKAVGTPANPCNPSVTSATYGTSGSASVAIYSDDFHAKNVTIANDAMKNVVHGVGYPAGANGSSGAQAVALMTQGDRLVFENVRVLGHQDSLYVKTANTATVSRAYFRKSYVEGDVDFIFGRGTAVFDRCEIRYLSTRLPVGQSTAMLAPSTSPLNRYGMLFIHSSFSADEGTLPGSIHLGRAWDEGVNSTTNPYVPGVSPNGQLLVRNSILGAHIQPVAPWTASTSRRPWSAEGNRFAEHRNTVLAP